jgi:hypothetical protein
MHYLGRREIHRVLACAAVLVFLAGRCGPKEGTLTGDVFIVTQGGENVKLGLVEVRVLSPDAAKNAVEQTTRRAEHEVDQLRPSLEAAKAEFQARIAALAVAKAEYEIANARFSGNISSTSLMNKCFAAQHRYLDAGFAKDKAEAAIKDVEALMRHTKSGEVYFAHLPSALASAKTDADGKFSITLDSKTPVVLAAQATRHLPDKVENYYWLVRTSLDGQATKRIFLSNDNLATIRSPDSLVLVSE